MSHTYQELSHYRQSKVVYRLAFRNNLHIASIKQFHIELVNWKSSYLRLILLKGQTSRPYSKTGRHLVLISSRITSSDAILPILPKIPIRLYKHIKQSDCITWDRLTAITATGSHDVAIGETAVMISFANSS